MVTEEEVQEKLDELLEEINNLPNKGYGIVTRAWVAIQLKYNKVLIFENIEDPKPQLIKIIDSLINIVKNSKEFNVGNVMDYSKIHDKSSQKKIEQLTHNLYGDCWVNFNPKQYDEATELLKERFERNNVPLSLIKDKLVLDDGCGGGRYSIALSRLGAKKVIGLDMGTKGIEFANTKAKELGLEEKVEFKVGNVLDLPFDDNTFDFIFSNGVIHHTVDIEKGVAEISRVLKPEGHAWIFVQGKGGFQWTVTDVCREIVSSVPREITQELIILNGIPQNRVFYIMDHLYVPIQNWQTQEEFETLLKRYNLSDYRRLLRGVKFDGIEKITNEEPFAKEKYGISELRYLAKKGEA